MRLGCFVSPDLIEPAADAGYDFVELPAAVLLPEEPEETFAPVRERLTSGSVEAEVWDLSPPSQVAVCGPSVDWPRAARYANTAIRRAASVGGCVVTFACGECCDLAGGFAHESAVEQITDFLRVAAAVGRSYGLIVAVEPLAPGSSALVNSLPEAAELARQVNMPEVGVLPNCLHIAEQAQSAFDVVDAASWLAHAHVSLADLQPTPTADDAAKEFVKALRLADYDGRLTVQADWREPKKEMRRAIELLRRCCERTRENPHGES